MFTRKDENGVLIRNQVGLDTGKGLTKQSMAKECDINVIMRKYERTRQISWLSNKAGAFMDMPAIDFQQAMDLVVQANSDFESMPAKLRQRFMNDPLVFMQFVQDPANTDELVSLGLVDRPVSDQVPEPVPSPTPTPAP